MVRLGKGMTTSINISTKRSSKKQTERFSITDITKQDFRQLLKKFGNSLCLGYKSKQVHNEPNEAYLLLIKHINKIIKSESNVRLSTKVFKSIVNEIIVNFNKTVVCINKATQSEELESMNIMTKYAYKI